MEIIEGGLWSRVIRAKYCKNRCDIDMFQHKHDALNVWHDITEGVAYIQQGYRAEIGNGKPTSFWKHKWACSRPLIRLAVQEVPLNMLELTVQGVWDQNRGWK